MEDASIAVRAFLHDGSFVVGKQNRKPTGPSTVSDIGPSEWVLIFDTETMTDAAQQLRFGCYQLRQLGELDEIGFFYNPTSLSELELELLKRYAQAENTRVITLTEFVKDIFYGVGYKLGATIVGLNLPFDIPRLAIKHGPAKSQEMRGGFTIQLDKNKDLPNVQIKHLSRRAAKIRFAGKRGQTTGRGMKNRNLRVPQKRGYFVDVKTLAAALTGKSFGLSKLADFLKLADQKQNTDEHGRELTENYLDYALQDVQTTWACYDALMARFKKHGLTKKRADQIYSEAGLGKAILREMRVKPWRETQSNMPVGLIGQIMSTYYGGRAEIRIRREVRQIAYCDFLSMYPTVCTLMGLWRFVIADGMKWTDATAEIQSLLDSVTLGDLQTQKFWKKLHVIVQLKPDVDLYPVRTRYGDEPNNTIGLNHLTSAQPLWFTLADCIAAKLLNGETSKILQAIQFNSGPMQKGLQPINIAGQSEYRVDPVKDDFFCRLIDLRSAVKKMKDVADQAEKSRLNTEQLGFKILANSTSYGIYVELNNEDLIRLKAATCHGFDGVGKPLAIDKTEKPGPYFHPLLGTLITGAARLMLGIAEHLALEAGLDWVFCDTDSLAIAKPTAMSDGLFWDKVKAIREWFTPLNPYAEKGPLLKLEDVNYGLKNSDEIEPLFAYAISAKRYALFNLDYHGRATLRKATGHGLGYLLGPNMPSAELDDCATDDNDDEDGVGVRPWAAEFWLRVVQAALDGHLNQVDLASLPGFDSPAVSQYSATNPRQLGWFKKYNRRKPYPKQVRPFGFMLTFQASRLATDPSSLMDDVPEGTRSPGKRGHHVKAAPSSHLPKVVAPYDTDRVRAVKRCFDRETGDPVSAKQLKTYRQALDRFHIHPEAKFHNAKFRDHGRTERRHINATSINLIGKEANRWEEQFYLGLDPEAQLEFGMTSSDQTRLLAVIQKAVDVIGIGKFATATNWSRRHLTDILAGRRSLQDLDLAKLAKAAAHLTAGKPSTDEALDCLRKRCKENGLRAMAMELGIDDGNLSRILSGKRKLSMKILEKIGVPK